MSVGFKVSLSLVFCDLTTELSEHSGLAIAAVGTLLLALFSCLELFLDTTAVVQILPGYALGFGKISAFYSLVKYYRPLSLLGLVSCHSVKGESCSSASVTDDGSRRGKV